MCCVRRYIQYNILMLFHKVLFHSTILPQKQTISCTGKSFNYKTQNYYPEFSKLLCLLAYCFEASHSQYYQIMLESLLIELGFVMNTNYLTIRRAHKQELYLKLKIPYPASEQEFK
jgi:hypothetical protein